MAGDRFPAALWRVARFAQTERRPDSLDVTDPSTVLASVRLDIETEISAMLRGHKSSTIVELCLGAIVIREIMPSAREWVAATALLRSPVAQRAYNSAFDFSREQMKNIRRVAKVLASAGKLSAAEVLWLLDDRKQQAA
jgi:hypothetical protein